MNSLPRQQFTSRVSQNTPLCRDHFRLILNVAQFPRTAPGQFIQMLCRDASFPAEREIDWNLSAALRLRENLPGVGAAMLRRPFSLAARRDIDSGVELEIIHRVIGTGTRWLAQLEPEATVDILGPLGTSFSLPGANETAILVGGGVGIPPMLYLAASLTGRAIAFCGATTRDLLPLSLTSAASGEPSSHGPNQLRPALIVEEFARFGISSVVTTDDGSFGVEGLVTDALERYLQSIEPSPTVLRPVIYTCGPEPMMKRVAQIAHARGICCQIAVERAMACGMGTCQSCCIRVRKKDPPAPPMAGSDWCYRLACTDGPVFSASDLLW